MFNASILIIKRIHIKQGTITSINRQWLARAYWSGFTKKWFSLSNLFIKPRNLLNSPSRKAGDPKTGEHDNDNVNKVIPIP